MRFSVVFPAVLVALLALAACAPRATSSSALESPEAQALEQTATIAFHRMAIGRLQTGEYTTNALLELELPQGVKWTLEQFSSSDYLLRFTSAKVPGFDWLVTPEGVRVVAHEG